MKKKAAFLLVLLLLALCAVCPAMANSWGLRGPLLSAVESSGKWGDYQALSNQVGDAAVMHGRYHNTLMLLENGKLRTFPTAVYQPDDGRDRDLSFSGNWWNFVIRYGAKEWFSFQNTREGWYLMEAQHGALTITSRSQSYASSAPDGYIATDRGGTYVIPYPIPLSEFNIRFFPRSTQEIIHLNQMHAALASGEHVLGSWPGTGDAGTLYRRAGRGTTPVFSAPYGPSAWRAAKGKAAVGLAGDVWLLRCVNDMDCQRWACVRYEVSERTQRIGYILADTLGLGGYGQPTEDFIRVPVYATRTTLLTDDPVCSQYAQFTVPAGTQLDCIGLYNRDYAYVWAEVRNGRFADGGEIVWGFVPLRDLALDTDRNAEFEWDVMDELAGEWEFFAGGSQAEDLLILYSDGSYTAQLDSGDDTDSNRGFWYVTAYDPDWNLYWNNPPYEITFECDDGTCNIKGLLLQDDRITLSDREDSSSYRRVAGEESVGIHIRD